jgi:5-methylcytosine-specific restriction endonuclease McrA
MNGNKRMTRDECVEFLGKMGWPDWKSRLAYDACFCCEYCGRDLLATIDDHRAWEYDHIVPVTSEGSDREENRAVACKVCNWLKGNRIVPSVDPTKDRNGAINEIREKIAPLRQRQSDDLAQIRRHFRTES